MFAYKVQELLETGSFPEAADICRNGLKEFPDYALAYSLLTEALIGLNDMESANATVREALDRFPLYKPLLNLSDKLTQISYKESKEPTIVISQEDIENQFEQLKKNNIILFSGFKNIINRFKIDSADEIFSKLFFTDKSNKAEDGELKTLGKAISESTDYFRKLAESIGSGKINVDEKSSGVMLVNDDEEPSIVSEAMAEIYENQGAIKTAIKSYQLLIEKNPEKKEFYLSKINELEKLI